MNYQQALAYIYSFADYERGGTYMRALKEDLSLEALLFERLGNPHQHYTSTLIAGTKGKGSTAAYVERVLREAGIRTGLYTQPDLHTFRERAQVNGRPISEEELAALVPDIRSAVDSILAQESATPFITYHISTALALLYFYRQRVQHAVLEVGLGGRLDATNVTHPLVSVITSISYDHMSILGDTLAQIATEKAGIIKQNGIVVTSAQSPEALLAIARIARQRQARMLRIGSALEDPAQALVDTGQLPALSYRYRSDVQMPERQRFTIWTPDHVCADLETPLLGLHQLENATVALAALDQLREQGLIWDETALRTGFSSVHWPARIEVVGHNPTVIVDGAHNADSLQKLLQTLRSVYSMRRLIVVLSMHKDKDLARSIKELAAIDSVILTRMHNLRAASSADLAALFAQYAPAVKVYQAADSNQAMQLALDLADPDDLICATGSLYLSGEVLRWAAAHGSTTVAAEIAGIDH